MSKKESTVTTLGPDSDTTGELLDQANPVEPTTVHASNHDAQLSGKKINMTIFEQEGVVGKEAVFVSVNGYGYQIPRNVPVTVPEEVAAIVQQAKYTTYEAAEGGGHRARDVHRFAFAIHGPAAQ